MSSAATALDARLATLGRAFDGDVGLAVRDVQTGWTSHYRGTVFHPQQSVSKLWVAITLLDRVDRGVLDLGQAVTVSRDDLTLFHQPVRALALRPGGYQTTLGDLLFRALTASDNTANDVLLWKLGGPDVVRATLQQKGITGIRFGPGERLLQSGIAGLRWDPDYAIGNAFYAARDEVSASTRKRLFKDYVADPVDGATAVGMSDALARLRAGDLLSPASTQRLLSIMGQTRTGPQRLKGALRGGWTLAHKTGTGQVFDGAQAGYNDVGILTSPEGRSYAVAVLIGRTSTPLPTRMRLMQDVARAAMDYDRVLEAQRQSASIHDQAPLG